MSSQAGTTSHAPDRLVDQVAILTGASSGLGLGVARALAKPGRRR